MTRPVILCVLGSADVPVGPLQMSERLVEDAGQRPGRPAGHRRTVLGRHHPDRPEVRDLWLSWQDVTAVEEALAGGLVAGWLRSAAVLPAVPPPDGRWIVREWPGKLLVPPDLAERLSAALWTGGPLGLEDLDLYLLTPRRPGQEDEYAEPPGHARVESTREYRESMESVRPTVVTATAEKVLRRMGDWFGDLADDRVGGAVALLALSGVRATSTGPVELLNPAALGMRRVDGDTTLAAHRRAGRIRTRAWGVGRVDSDERTNAGYGVRVEFTALVDPEVLVDTGVVFEQESLIDVQTLATAVPYVTTVDVGRPATGEIPAWCLNRDLRAPSGGLVRPTPFCLSLSQDTSQAAVWQQMEQARRRFTS